MQNNDTDQLNVEETSEVIKSNKEVKKRGFFYEWGIPVIAAVILALLINKFLIFKVYIPSESMVPTLNVEDRLFVTRTYNLDNLKNGDVIVFYSDELQETLIKRLIGLPGDQIDIEDGLVSVNGTKLNEEYVQNKDNYSGSFKVPEGKYFFLGDNRPVSADSRKWINPYIDGDDIMGKAQIKIYPFDDFGSVK